MHVDSRQQIIKQENVRLGVERSCKGNTCLLATGQSGALLTDHRLIAVCEQLEIPLETGIVNHLLVFLLVVWLAEQDVVLHSIVDDPRLLRDQTDSPVDRHPRTGQAFLEFHFTKQGVHDGGLAAADIADNRHDFSFFNCKVDIGKREWRLDYNSILSFLIPVEISILHFDGIGPVRFVLVISDTRSVDFLCLKEGLDSSHGIEPLNDDRNIIGEHLQVELDISVKIHNGKSKRRVEGTAHSYKGSEGCTEDQFRCEPHGICGIGLCHKFFMHPSDLLISALDQLIIEVLLPRIHLHKFDVIEHLVCNFHTVVSRSRQLLLVPRRRTRNYHICNRCHEQHSKTSQESRMDEHRHEGDGVRQTVRDEDHAVETLGEETKPETVHLHQTGNLPQFELFITKRRVPQRFVDHSQGHAIGHVTADDVELVGAVGVEKRSEEATHGCYDHPENAPGSHVVGRTLQHLTNEEDDHRRQDRELVRQEVHHRRPNVPL